MKNQTNNTAIKSSVKSAIDNIVDFRWVDADPLLLNDIDNDFIFTLTPFGDYTIMKYDYPSVCYRLYFNDNAISNDVDDIDYLKKLALKDYQNKLFKVFDL